MRLLGILTLMLLPIAFASAQAPRDFRELVDLFVWIIDWLIVLVFAITFIVFIWGMTKAWILNVGNETEVEKGKKLALWGIIVLAIMSGIWGIINLLRYSFFGI